MHFVCAASMGSLIISMGWHWDDAKCPFTMPTRNLKACGSKSPFRDPGPLEIEEARLLDSLIMIGTRMMLGWCHGGPLRATRMTLRMIKSGPSNLSCFFFGLRDLL